MLGKFRMFRFVMVLQYYRLQFSLLSIPQKSGKIYKKYLLLYIIYILYIIVLSICQN